MNPTAPQVAWESVADAFALIAAGKAKRIDGAGFSVYAVGPNIIRVDVRVAS